MQSLLVTKVASAFVILPLVLLSDSHCFLTSANSLRVNRQHHSQENTASGEKVSLFGGKVLLSPPAEFVKMTDELIAKKFPEVNVPRVAFANAEGTVSVFVGFAEERNLRPQQLPEFKEFMISTLERAIPGIRWLTKDFVEIDGRRWVHLEYISRREGSREVHNDVYITSLENRMLFCNFNSVTSEYEKFKGALQRSKESIVVKGP